MHDKIDPMKIVFIGSGNLATNLAKALHDAGHHILQIYSYTEINAQKLARCVAATATHQLEALRDDADIYIFAVKDDVLQQIISQMPHKKGVWLHTAGSIPMDIFSPFHDEYGVFYPIQTFSKERPVPFSSIPIFIEASHPKVKNRIERLARSISTQVQILSSDKRKYLHLAAVFACNFTNHLYALASEIVERENISFDALKPLIAETAAKIMDMAPQQAQTGPAVRMDENVMRKHLQLIRDDELKEIYLQLSKSIHNHSI